jgi:60 kDa SS-A/Ro ribonucleoprotein
MKTNAPVSYHAETHEGGVADPHQKPAAELERAVATCLLFENTFYESGNDLAARIAALVATVEPGFVRDLAVRARTDYKLRHVPLFLCRHLAKRGELTQETLAAVIQRPDEITEFLSLYWGSNDGKRSLPRQVKKGLALAFRKFSEYQLAKWNRDGAVKLRDALFLCHAKPKDEEQAALWKRLVDRTLATPDTWEVALSGATTPEAKHAAWTRLLAEDKLGQIALLMNLRNMVEAKVERSLIAEKLMASAKAGKALPFRFVSALKHAPSLADVISEAMVESIDRSEPLAGTTFIVVDVSGSMDDRLSEKSEMTRLEAAGALAVLIREIAEGCRIFTFSTGVAEIPVHRGLALVSAIDGSQPHGGTRLALALEVIEKDCGSEADRVVVITDEQASGGGLPKRFGKHGYILNVATYKPALHADWNGWKRFSGWSERVVEWMRATEREDAR